jgi:signal transduction histidine kinase
MAVTDRQHAQEHNAARRSARLPGGRAWANRSVRTKGLVVVAIPVTALVVASLLFGVATAQERQAQAAVLQTVEVERQIAQVRILVQSGVGGYLLTGQDQYLTAYQAASSQLPTAQSRLSALVRDDPSQLSHLRQVTKLIERRLEIVAALVSSVQNNDPPRRRGLLLDRNKRTVDALNAQLDVMRATELGRLADRREHARRARMLAFGAIGLSVLLGLAGGLVATLLFTSGVTRRARQLEHNARRLAQGEPLLPSCPGEDDLGRAGRSLQDAAVLLGAREQSLRQAKHAAEQANQAKSEYLSRMSHELRTPLNAILGFAQLMELDELRDEQRENLAHVLSGARHLLGLINEVLDIAAIEAGRLRLSLEPLVAADLIAETMGMIRPLADQQGILLTGPRVPAATHVLGDRQRLKQILLNLLSNAVKYNRQGGTVTVACKPVEGERLRLSVADTGPGIPAESLDRLFVPFERLGYEHSAVEGTGLGLPLAQRLAEAMGGTLAVVSDPGKGSTFWIELALAEAPDDHDWPRPKAAAPSA